MKIKSLLLFCASLLASACAHATLVGDTVRIAYVYPDLATEYKANSAVVGAGAEFTYVYSATINFFTVDISAGSIDIQVINSFNGPTPPGVTHDGILVSGLDDSSLAALSGLAGFATNSVLDVSRISFGDDFVFFDMSNTNFIQGQSIHIDLQFAAVPEPASLALLALGLTGLAAARRRRLPRQAPSPV